MTLLVPASKTSGRSRWLPRVFLLLACFVLPQQAAAQTDNRATLVSLAPASLSAAEGGSFTWTVNLSAPVDVPVGIAWTATNGSDLSPGTAAASVADDLVASSGTVEIGTGDTSAAITIPIAADGLSEGDEIFTVTITGNGDLPAGVALAPSASSAIGTIIEEALDATLSLADARAAEGDGAIRFTVSVSQALGSEVVLILAYSGGSATLDRDLGVRLPGRVIIPAGSTSASFDVPITDDGVAEGEESFSVSISAGSLPQGVTIVDATATGTITDADTALGVVLQLTPPPKRATQQAGRAPPPPQRSSWVLSRRSSRGRRHDIVRPCREGLRSPRATPLRFRRLVRAGLFRLAAAGGGAEFNWDRDCRHDSYHFHRRCHRDGRRQRWLRDHSGSATSPRRFI